MVLFRLENRETDWDDKPGLLRRVILVRFCFFWLFSARTLKRTGLGLSGPFWPFWASLGLSGLLWASLGFSGPLWASLSLSEPRRASLGLFGLLWASPGLSGLLWASPAVSVSGPLSPPARQPASHPASRPSAGQACSVHAGPLWASLGFSGLLWAFIGLSGPLSGLSGATRGPFAGLFWGNGALTASQ